MADPIQHVTEETLNDIARYGVLAGGLDYSPAALAVARGLLAAAQGTAGVELPPEFRQLVDSVRGIATVEIGYVPMPDGVQLSTVLINQNAGGQRPLVVVPAGWSPYGWLPFVWTYLTLAAEGYHVLAYTPRGLGDPALPSTSGGFIDVGGPQDRADATYLLTHTYGKLDISKVGFLGESYGSGISQLVAAHDSRVSVVVALSTWGSLATSLYDNGTRHLAALRALVGFTGGPVTEKFDPETRALLEDFEAGRNMEAVIEWALDRSPEHFLALTNKLDVPTFMSNTWHETLFPVNQLLDTFTHLTVPKQLNLWIGDHGAPEGAGLVGVPTGIAFPGLLTPMQEARNWLRHYLTEDGDAPETGVRNQIMFTYRTQPVPGGGQRIIEPATRERQSCWGENTRTERWYLADGVPDCALGDKADAGWERNFRAGNETQARATDTPLLQTGQREWYGTPKVYRLDDFERDQLLIWLTDSLPEGRRLRGAPTVKLTVRSPETTASFVAYLFDVAADNTAHLITHEPYTVDRLTPEENRTIEWRLQAACYDLPEGHRLALVVNSRDLLYSYAGGGTTTVGSLATAESYLDLTLG
ncbi:hypothetical protein JK358_36095 [Nocardia sp. 2]|uniref:Xaa-Pro dipeptidyl-peptidase C-terminal domain-containing protein n=1 Tax=Nocardia acididurans TaxID=2802282 RepID=A0ABS1MJI9_9NOCA|nr:CocE/NonD family hydrolase C-terminal non-catalytic domain-containing protein [Nocardia acididurans]MBL1079839.1 hypothetical protein [Nocardia acididurans]